MLRGQVQVASGAVEEDTLDSSPGYDGDLRVDHRLDVAPVRAPKRRDVARGAYRVRREVPEHLPRAGRAAGKVQAYVCRLQLGRDKFQLQLQLQLYYAAVVEA